MSPDLAFGCAHRLLEVITHLNGTKSIRCRDCTTTLATWVGPIRGGPEA